MYANTYFTPSNYTPIAGGAGLWVANSVPGNFAGIDAKLAALSSNIPQVVWADSVTGNDSTADGSENLPYLTYGAASAAIASSAFSTNRYVINLVGNFTGESGMILYPFVNINGLGTAIFTTGGTVALDSSWDSVSNPFCRIDGLILNAAQAFIQFNTYQGASLEFNVNWNITSDVQVHGSATDGPEFVSFYGVKNYSGTPIEYEMYDVSSYFENVEAGLIVINNNNSIYASETVVKNCKAISQIFNSTSSSQDSYLFVYGSPQTPYIDLQDNKSYLTIDSASYTSQAVLSGSATTANINIVSLADGVNCSTYTPIHFTPIPTSAYGSNSLPAYLAGLDAAIASVIPGTPIAQQLWVNATNGNDSNAGTMPDNSLATYDVGAYPIVLANASSSNPYVVYIIGNSTVTSNFNILPFCTVIVLGGLLTIPGQMNLDGIYASSAASVSKVSGMINAVGGISLDYGSADGHLVVLNIDPTTTPTINCAAANTTTSNSIVFSAIPNAEIYAGMFLSGITFQDLNMVMQNAVTYSTISMTGTGTGNAALAMQNSQVNFQLVADGTSGPLYVQLQNTFTQQLNVMGINPVINVYDDQSYPGSLLLNSGALISQIGILGSPDGLAFSQTFSPANFSLVGGTNWLSNSTTAAFAGVDAALAAGTIGTLRAAYNNGPSGEIDLTTDNLNPLFTTNSVRGVGSTIQRHYEATNTVDPNMGPLGYWGIGNVGYNTSLVKIPYTYDAAFATNANAGSETATYSSYIYQSGSNVVYRHINAATQQATYNYQLVNLTGSQIFNSTYTLASNYIYGGEVLGLNVISDDVSVHDISLQFGYGPNLNDCFYVTTRGTYAVTITPTGGATINGSTSVYTVPIYSKATVQLVDSGSNAWIVTVESQISDNSSGAFPFTWDSGNSSNLTTTNFIFGTYTVTGDYVTANITLQVYPNATSSSSCIYGTICRKQLYFFSFGLDNC